MSAAIPLDSLLRSLRSLDDADAVHDTLDWRQAIVRELCRIVEHAHVRGLAHPGLAARNVLVDGGSEVRVVGWVACRSADARDDDVRALGRIAHELLTLEEPPAPSR